ncbi:MAG: IS1 family transposase [Cyanobacteria bacterium P01_H01_bin.74]
MAFHSKKSQKCWIWLAWDRERQSYCGLQLGRRNAKTGQQLWQQLSLFANSVVCTDDYPVYGAFVPQEQHIVTKAETWGVESLNSRIRHYLARFRRKTFCYSKALHMVQVTLMLFFTSDWEAYLY